MQWLKNHCEWLEKSGEFRGETAGNTSRGYEVLDDPPPHQPLPREAEQSSPPTGKIRRLCPCLAASPFKEGKIERTRASERDRLLRGHARRWPYHADPSQGPQLHYAPWTAPVVLLVPQSVVVQMRLRFPFSASSSRRTPTICSSANRLRFIASSPLLSLSIKTLSCNDPNHGEQVDVRQT